jgi:hypothetical protein
MPNRKEPALPSKEQQKLADAVSELMQSASACWPHCELTPATASEHMKIWIKLANKYGLSRLQTGLERLKFKLDFFPKPADISKELDLLIQEERSTARANTSRFVSCGKCSRDGLILINQLGARWTGSKDEERFAKECDCLKVWKASLPWTQATDRTVSS